MQGREHQLCGAVFLLLACMMAVGCRPAPQAERPRLNVLLIVADDLDWSSVGAFGSLVPDVTPNIDRLAAEGMRFERAHVTVSICQPSRAVWMTGRYPHRNGALGFTAIDPGVPTLLEALHDAGYYTGILDKVDHVVPTRSRAWDEAVPSAQLGAGRDPLRYHGHSRAFLTRARAAKKPFFLMANLRDPHRPFAGSGEGPRLARRFGATPAEASRIFSPEQVVVPGFLPDVPPIRREMAHYFTSVRRADDTVGAVLRALADEDFAEDTLVMFLSDNGISMPFGKSNCWYHSTRTPWIVRWPGIAEAGHSDTEHFVAGIDLAPTVLEATGLPSLPDSDGRSFVPLLRGERQPDRTRVFTQVDGLQNGSYYPMRSVQDRSFGYVFNAWSDGLAVFQSEAQSGVTMTAMTEAGRRNPAIAARVRHFLHRTPEELYDYEKDPNALHNLIDDPRHAQHVANLRRLLLEHMERTGDPQLESFRRHVGTMLESSPDARSH